MDATSTASEAHGTLTTAEEIHCHKARIFSLLAKAPVVRAWKDAVCDGAVYLGKASLPESYADRYFHLFKDQDFRFVTFSIVTAFEETVFDAEGQEIERSQCHIPVAQREASEFLIVTFSNDYDTIALLPRSAYWPIEGNEGTGDDDVLPNEVSASNLSDHSYPIRLLLAYIEEIRRLTVNPMDPTTTPFQISLNGRIPRADYPKAIGPHYPKAIGLQPSAPQLIEGQKERVLRAIHKQCPMMRLPMKIDFLHYQPLLRDFRIIIPSGEMFPDGLEVVINHNFGNEKDSPHLRYADYILTHGVTLDLDHGSFIPRGVITEDWFEAALPGQAMPTEFLDNVDITEFIFIMDSDGKWLRDVWRIICKYPPGEHPTPAEEKQEIWKKAFPWPEIEAQVTSQKVSTPQKSQRDEKQLRSKHDSGTGDDRAVKPSDVSLLAAHYLEKASLGGIEAGKDTE